MAVLVTVLVVCTGKVLAGCIGSFVYTVCSLTPTPLHTQTDRQTDRQTDTHTHTHTHTLRQTKALQAG